MYTALTKTDQEVGETSDYIEISDDMENQECVQTEENTQNEKDFQAFTNFDNQDIIYEEFTDLVDPPSKRRLFKRTLQTVLSMQFSSAFIIGSLSILCIYVDLYLANLCDSTKWKDLPHSIQVLHVFSKSVIDQLFLFWYFAVLCLIFPMSQMKRQMLILANLSAGCIATIYRLSTLITNIYGTSSMLGMHQYGIFIIMNFYTTWHCLQNNIEGKWKRMKYIVLINTQCVLGLLFHLVTLHFVLPFYVESSLVTKMSIAFLIPAVGYVLRISCRYCLQYIKTIFHPGHLYMLSTGLHAATITVYRLLQANIHSTGAFLLLSFGHAVVGGIVQITGIYQRHFIALLVRCKGSRYRIERNPREKRESTDIIIMTIIYETWGVVVTNCVNAVYAIQHRIPNQINMPYNQASIIQDMLYRIFFTILFETISALISTHIIIKKTKFPLISVWHRQHRLFILTLTINAMCCIFLFSKTLTVATEETYYSYLIVKHGRIDLATQLKMCNHTSKLF